MDSLRYTGQDQQGQQVKLFSDHALLNTVRIEANYIYPHPSLLPRNSLKNWKVWSLKTDGLLFHHSALHHLVEGGVRKVKLTWADKSEELPLWALFGCGDFCEALRHFEPKISWLSSSTLPHLEIKENIPGAWVDLIDFLERTTKTKCEKAFLHSPIDSVLRLYKLATDKHFPLLREITKTKIESNLEKKLTANNCAQILELTLELELEKESKTCLTFIKEKCFGKNNYVPIGFAVVHKKIALTKTLFSAIEMTGQLAQELVDKAIKTGDPDILNIVLTAIDNKKIPALLEKHKKTILSDSHPERWKVIYDLYPTGWFQTEDDSLDFQVIREGKIFWIKYFDKEGLYQHKPVFHHIVEKCGAERVNLFAGAVKDVRSLLQVEEEGQTPFGAAMRATSPQMAAALLGLHTRHKVPIDPKAFTTKHPNVIDDIITNGLQEHKDSLLTWAIFLRPQSPAPDLAYKLLEAEANPNITWEGESILDKLCETKLFKMGTYLINKGLNKEVQTAATTTAVNSKRWGWIALFIKHNIGLDWIDNQGRTLLHYAAETGQEELCKELDPWKQDAKGTTPHDLSKNKNLFNLTTGD